MGDHICAVYTITLRCDNNTSIRFTGINHINNYIANGIFTFLSPDGLSSIKLGGREKTDTGSGKKDGPVIEMQDLQPSDRGAGTGTVGMFFKISALVRPGPTPIC